MYPYVTSTKDKLLLYAASSLYLFLYILTAFSKTKAILFTTPSLGGGRERERERERERGREYTHVHVFKNSLDLCFITTFRS